MKIQYDNTKTLKDFAQKINSTGNHDCLKDLAVIEKHVSFHFYENIQLDNIEVVPENQQSRRNGAKDKDVSPLAEQILAIGLKNPIVVKPFKNSRYQLVSGHHRYEAFQKNKKKDNKYSSIPCIVVSFENQREESLMRQKANSNHLVGTNHNRQDAAKFLDDMAKMNEFPFIANKEEKRRKWFSIARELLGECYPHLSTTTRENAIKDWYKNMSLGHVQEGKKKEVSEIVERIKTFYGMETTKAGIICPKTKRVFYGSTNGTSAQNFRKSLGELCFHDPSTLENLECSIMVIYKSKIGLKTKPKDIKDDRETFEKLVKDFNELFSGLVDVQITDIVYPRQILKKESDIGADPLVGIHRIWHNGSFIDKK